MQKGFSSVHTAEQGLPVPFRDAHETNILYFQAQNTCFFFYLCVGYWRSGRSGRGEWFTVGDLDRSQRIYAVKINLRKLKFTCEGRGSSLHYA